MRTLLKMGGTTVRYDFYDSVSPNMASGRLTGIGNHQSSRRYWIDRNGNIRLLRYRDPCAFILPHYVKLTPYDNELKNRDSGEYQREAS